MSKGIVDYSPMLVTGFDLGASNFQNLCFAPCCIYICTAQALFTALPQNESLTELHLNNNRITGP